VARAQQWKYSWKRCFLCVRSEAISLDRWIEWVQWGGDRKGSLESERVKYGRESHRTLTREWMPRRGPAAIVNDRPILSSERLLYTDYDSRCSIEKKFWSSVLRGSAPRRTASRKVTLTDCDSERVQWVQYSAVERVGWWVSESEWKNCWDSVRVSCCWGTGTVRESRGRGTSAVGSRYQETGEDSGWEHWSVCSCEL
jgi:hypothetical protein